MSCPTGAGIWGELGSPCSWPHCLGHPLAPVQLCECGRSTTMPQGKPRLIGHCLLWPWTHQLHHPSCRFTLTRGNLCGPSKTDGDITYWSWGITASQAFCWLPSLWCVLKNIVWFKIIPVKPTSRKLLCAFIFNNNFVHIYSTSLVECVILVYFPVCFKWYYSLVVMKWYDIFMLLVCNKGS